MNRRRLLVLGLLFAAFAGGALLMRYEDPASTEPPDANSAGKRSQPERVEPRLLSGQGQRDALRSDSTRATTATRPLPRERSMFDDSASGPNRLSGANGSDADFSDLEEPSDFVIGGLVQDEDGNPQPRFGVSARRIDPPHGESEVAESAADDGHTSYSDASGFFLFDGLEDAEYLVSLVPVPGIAPAEIRVRAGTLNASLVVIVLRDVRVYGTVKSTKDEPLKGVHIISGPSVRNTRTGSKGEYELDIIWRGKNVVQTIIYQHEGYKPQRIRIDPSDLEDVIGDYQLDVTMEPLDRLTSFSGRLTNTEGDPVIGKTLSIVTPQMQIKYRAESDVNGNFWFDDVEPGEDYQLQIRPGSGYKNKDINPLVIPAGGLHLDIVLELGDTGELSGWMIGPDGSPVPGFSMTLHSTVATGESVGVVGDGQGFFLVEDFPIGGAILRTNSFPLLTVQGLRVSLEPEDPVTVVLDIGRHVLHGRVTDEFGGPVAASSITLDWGFRDKRLLNSSSRKTSADQHGTFVFTDLGPDVHLMEVTAPGFLTVVRTIDVGSHQNEIVVELQEVAQ